MPRPRTANRLPALMTLVVLTAAWTAGAASAATADTDGDGLPDWYERDRTLTSQTLEDTDTDGIADGAEDLDGDKLRNATEMRAVTHPRVADTDGDGIRDDREDADADGLLNVEEQAYRTDPRLADTDADTWRDANEVRAATDPRSAASVPAGVGIPPWVPSASPCPIFPASNVWNQRVDGLPINARSTTFVTAVSRRRPVSSPWRCSASG